MYIEKLGKKEGQINLKILMFIAKEYNIDFMASKTTNKSEGYRAYQVKYRAPNGHYASDLFWVDDYSFGSTIDDRSDFSSWHKFIYDNMYEISPALAESYFADKETASNLKLEEDESQITLNDIFESEGK
ncbi:MAG: hypothetical protein E7345_04300 [Clostridiales bacterium]|nr:hypothetical protein [Clostridiales bacterium]